MTIEEMRTRKREMGYTYEQIAELTGIDFETIKNILEGMIRSPRYDILQMLEDFFEPEMDDVVREPGAAYQVKPQKEQGKYTIEDYFAWPEDERIELIDGVIYDMAAPTSLHQLIAGRVYTRFSNHIEKNNGKCIALISPADVQISKDDKTIVQPDVMILCDKKLFKMGRIYGAPDLIVEILSPSTRKKDMTIKLKKYTDSGVREYWIVDPRNKRIIAHDLEHGDAVTLYGFEEKVPVRIFDNKCEVDFAEIYDYISFLYEEEDGEL